MPSRVAGESSAPSEIYSPTTDDQISLPGEETVDNIFNGGVHTLTTDISGFYDCDTGDDIVLHTDGIFDPVPDWDSPEDPRPCRYRNPTPCA